jgi:epidermal growth factor receptor substrate 15
LIPSRDILNPPTDGASDQPPNSFPTGQTSLRVPQASSSQPVAPPKIPFDDDFDDFDGLEDAKEAEADDEFVNNSSLSHDRSGSHDFNPMFDSLQTSKGHEHTSQGNGSGNINNAFGDYNSSPVTAQPSNNAAAINDNQDWDAIFGGLQDPASAAAGPPNPVEATNGTSTSPPLERPEIGRALTEAGVHDDPILKNLTGMGYNRNESLAALEKYDYNLERVSSSYYLMWKGVEC